jgi:hypothetical protein
VLILTATGDASQPPLSLAPTAGAAWIALTGILRDGENLFAVFVADKSQRIVPVSPADLQSFTALQRRAAAERSLWIRHCSEEERTARQQARKSADEVQRAFERGAAK